jgi:hypothetical protein
MMHPDIVNDLVRERQRELIAANDRHGRQHVEVRRRHRRPIFRRA